MAEKQLKSITFPGIDNVYKVPDSIVVTDQNTDGNLVFSNYAVGSSAGITGRFFFKKV